MSYVIEGVNKEADEEGYLLEADYSEAAALVIAEAESITLTDEHWKIINYMRDKFREDGQTPNFRHMFKEIAEFVLPGIESKALYDLFPAGPAKQAAKIAGLPQPYGKGGY